MLGDEVGDLELGKAVSFEEGEDSVRFGGGFELDFFGGGEGRGEGEAAGAYEVGDGGGGSGLVRWFGDWLVEETEEGRGGMEEVFAEERAKHWRENGKRETRKRTWSSETEKWPARWEQINPGKRSWKLIK